jgi:hypothetical protein
MPSVEQLSNLMVEARSNTDALDASVIDAIAALLADSNDVVKFLGSNGAWSNWTLNKSRHPRT